MKNAGFLKNLFNRIKYGKIIHQSKQTIIRKKCGENLSYTKSVFDAATGNLRNVITRDVTKNNTRYTHVFCENKQMTKQDPQGKRIFAFSYYRDNVMEKTNLNWFISTTGKDYMKKS